MQRAYKLVFAQDYMLIYILRKYRNSTEISIYRKELDFGKVKKQEQYKSEVIISNILILPAFVKKLTF